MTRPQFLSMSKAIQYLGDAASAQQLLVTLQSTLESETHQLAQAIDAENMDSIQKLLHQLKGFAPVFCSDSLIADIKQAESLCKNSESPEDGLVAVQTSRSLLVNLNHLLAEVNAHLSGQA